MESILEKLPYTYGGQKVGQSVQVDVSQYQNGGYAFFVVARPWAGSGFTDVTALYLVSGIQNGAYQSCTPIVRQLSSGYGATVSISGSTLSISFINSLGGYYAIIPLYNVN